MFFRWKAFASQRCFVDEQVFGLKESAISWDAGTGCEVDHIAGYDIVDGNFDFLPVSLHLGRDMD